MFKDNPPVSPFTKGEKKAVWKSNAVIKINYFHYFDSCLV